MELVEKNINYNEFVAALVKPGKDILAEMTETQVELWHMATGVSGEAGELLDAVKKHCLYQKPLDFENMVEELGDLEFYMEGVRHLLGIPRQLTIDENIKKLSKRYEKMTYSNGAAIERADKA